MRSRLSLVALVLVALLIGIGSRPPESSAQASRATAKVSPFSGSVTASNAAITSTVGSTDVLVIHALTVNTNTAGIITITDGSSGVVLFTSYVAANTPTHFNNADLGPAGIRCSRGNTPYLSALASATSVQMTLWTDRE